MMFGLEDRVSLCSLGCPGTHSVDQAGLELTEIHLPLPPLGLKEHRTIPALRKSTRSSSPLLYQLSHRRSPITSRVIQIGVDELVFR